MQNNFTRGLIIGGIIGVSVAMMKPDMMNQRTRRRMMKSGRKLLRRSGSLIGDVVDLFR